ncbi:MAG: hypothetical protein MUO23_06730 [Anaerolineales bacterium]|nr:hypothetical protein [Anaerolineales bacterium]
MAAARHLSSWGAQLDIVLDGDPGRVRGPPAQPWHSLQAFGLTDSPPVGLGAPDWMLDALGDDAQPPIIRAAATLTTALPKVGLLLPQARPFVGELSLADVGVPPALYRDLGLQVGVLLAQGAILRLAEANSPRP